MRLADRWSSWSKLGHTTRLVPQGGTLTERPSSFGQEFASPIIGPDAYSSNYRKLLPSVPLDGARLSLVCLFNTELVRATAVRL
jgi:hypothetical protein